jgi:hypothetical protein
MNVYIISDLLEHPFSNCRINYRRINANSITILQFELKDIFNLLNFFKERNLNTIKIAICDHYIRALKKLVPFYKTIMNNHYGMRTDIYKRELFF